MAVAQIIDLTNLAASDGFIIQGDAASDQAGWSVSSAGDVNGDGIDDLIVGARYGDDGGSNAGEAYVIYGKTGSTRGTLDLTALAASDGFIIQGDAAGDQAGGSVSSAGDVNGDGIEDLIVGARLGDNGGYNAGEAYVIYGKSGSTRGTVDLTGLAASDGFIIQGDAASDFAGGSVSSAGDVNGDGIDDLIVGARGGNDGGIDAGEAYVIYGKSGSTRGTVDLTALAASDGFIIQGDAAVDGAGFSVSSAGDVNGDGIDDLIIGAPSGDDGGASAGEAYVIYGKSGSTRGTLDLTNLAASDGFIIQGDAADDNAGFSVSGAGDVNGDGIDDLIVGAFGGDDGGNGAGEAYVIFGKSGSSRGTVDLTGLAASDGFIIQGDAALDRAGYSVSSAGDINGDGIDDLIVGAPRGDDGGNYSGEAYVIFGKSGSTRGTLDLTNVTASDGFIIQGDAPGDSAGFSVSSAGDVNGDGIDDLIVGVIGGDDGGSEAGEAYVIYGSRSFGAINGTVGADTLTGTAGADTINGGEGNDVLDGGGGADRLNGGTGNDIFIVDDAGDVVTEAAGEGIDNVETVLAAYMLTANVENLEYTGAGAFDGTGNELANNIVGGAGGDTLLGLDGDDTLGGEAGDDTLNGGNGADRLNGGTGADTLNGGAGNDILVVDQGSDVANGDDGIDTVEIITANSVYGIAADIEIVSNKSGGDNIVNLNALANTYGGSNGSDEVHAGDGADVIYGRGGSDFLFGEAGNDKMFGDIGSDYLSGDDGNDLLYGGADNDSMVGGNGNDTLYGEAGNDILRGQTGLDILNGGLGADIYAFVAGDTGATIATADRIQGFSSAQGDLIDFSETGLSSFIGDASFSNTAGEVRSQVISGNTYVMGDVDGNGIADFMVRLDGVVTLSSGDFDFISG